MKHWNTFILIVVAVIISSGMMIANIDGLVYNVCTSDGTHGIYSLFPPNISHADVSIEILTINPGGSLNIQVSSDKKIKDIVLWAEFRGNSQKEQHIGAFKSIVGHAYAEGCDGLPNSTITNYEDFTNTSQIIYEWDPPLGTEITLTHPIHSPHDEKEPHQKHFPEHRHHHHIEEPCRGNKEEHRHHHPKNNKNHHHKHEKHHHIINQFTFKGVAFLENEPVKFHVFTLDEPIYVRGKIPSLNASSLLATPSASPTTSSTSPVASTNIGVYVSAFDNVDSATSNLQSNKWNRIGMMTMSFLATGILLIS